VRRLTDAMRLQEGLVTSVLRVELFFEAQQPEKQASVTAFPTWPATSCRNLKALAAADEEVHVL